MLNEAGQKLPYGLAKQWCKTESSAETVHLAGYYTILALGTWLRPNVRSSSSSCLSWHGTLLVIQLTVPSMLILLDSYIYVVNLVCAHLLRTWLLAGPVLGPGPRPAGCRGLATEGDVVAWLGWRSSLFTYNCWNPRG